MLLCFMLIFVTCEACLWFYVQDSVGSTKSDEFSNGHTNVSKTKPSMNARLQKQ